MAILHWLWAGLAVIFLVGEIFTAGFFLACFSVGAVVAAVLAFLDVGFAWQLGAFVVISAVAVVLSRPFAERITGEQTVGVGSDRVLGKRAVVLEEIDPARGTGRVRVDREEWRAEAIVGGPIAVGEWVEVVDIDGTHLRVKRQTEEHSDGGEA